MPKLNLWFRLPPQISRFWQASPEVVHLALRLLKTEGRQHTQAFAWVIVCMVLVSCCTAATAFLFGRVVNEVYTSKDAAVVALVCLVTIAVFSIKGIAAYWQAVLLARIQYRVIASNQQKIFEKIVTQPISYFNNRHSAEFSAILQNAPFSAAAMLNVLVTAFGRDLLSVIALVAVMVDQAPFLSLVALIVLPPSVIGVRKIVQSARLLARAQYEGVGHVLQILQETLHGYKVVRTFNLEQEMISRFKTSAIEIEKACNSYIKVSNRSGPMMETLGGVAVCLIMMYSGYKVLVLGQPPGSIVAFITAFLLAYEPAKRLARLSVDLSATSVAVAALFSVLDTPAEPDDSLLPELKAPAGRIEFKDVKFSYRPDAPVLNNLSFCVEPHEITALVGPSGSGKTTILNLLLRLYDNYEGSILVDGAEIRGFNRASVRANIAYVGQETLLFPGTIRDNIGRGKPGAKDEEIVSAAKAAFAEEFISAFPEGYNTLVGEHGVQLSGGQRQRIAIARAFIRDAKIVLLDEPTASLDGQAEYYLRAAISHLLKDRTTIIIAHGIHTIAQADRILVIEQGRMIEEGAHANLLAKPSQYRKLFELQQSALIEQD